MSRVRARRPRFFSSTTLFASVSALVLAGCSGDATRFASNPFQGPITTGSLTPAVDIGGGVQPQATQSAYPAQPVYQPQVTSAPQPVYPNQPIYQPQQQAQPIYQPQHQAQPVYQPQPVYRLQQQQQPIQQAQPVYPQQTQQVAAPQPVVRQQTAAIAPQPQPVSAPTQQSATRPATVTVASGDTAYGIASRYGVPVGSLLSANGISDPSRLRVGQTLVIPGASPAQVQQVAVQAPAPQPTPVTVDAPKKRAVRTQTITVTDAEITPRQAGPKTHVIASGETLYGIGRKYGVSANQIASANGITDASRLKVGQSLVIPSEGGAVAAKPVQTARLSQPSVQSDASPKPYVPPVAGTTGQDKPAAQAAVDKKVVSAASSGAPANKFRWPAEGRIISGFGPKTNGAHNDGINIAIPEGTPIRAAESGVVAYAGNELKGFGNLVLIRHDNDWVTAYAHANTMDVKRGDRITRGQVIGTAGQTGAVNSPQLHFEVRKGSRPVDPMQHLQAL